MSEMKNRSLLWDIFKGFGISFIVFGHTGKTGGAIVYLFHLALFFFVTGYFFNEEKFGDHPFAYFGRRLGSTWPRYMLYCIFFALTHNYCVVHGLMPAGAVIYGTTEFLSSVLNSMVMERPELYAGPMWFVPLWLLGGVLFAGIVKIGRRFEMHNAAVADKMSGDAGVPNVSGITGSPEEKTRGKLWKKQIERFLCLKNLIIILLSVACIAIGLYCVDVGLTVPYHMELAFVIEPFFAMGYFVKKYLPDWQEKLQWYLMVPVAVVIFFCFTRFIAAGIWFDLASQYIFGLWYYVGGVLGIIFTIIISKLLLMFKVPAGLMAVIGRYSFDIMAMHIFVFKMLDMVLRKIYYRDPGMDISAYPSPLSQKWWVIYLVVAIIVPVVLGMIIDRISQWISSLTNK